MASLLILFLKGIWAAQSYFHRIKKKESEIKWEGEWGDMRGVEGREGEHKEPLT